MNKITREQAEKLVNKIVVISHGLFDIEALKEDTIKSWQEEGLIEEVDYEKEADEINLPDNWLKDVDVARLDYLQCSVSKKIALYKKAITQLKEKLNNS